MCASSSRRTFEIWRPRPIGSRSPSAGTTCHAASGRAGSPIEARGRRKSAGAHDRQPPRHPRRASERRPDTPIYDGLYDPFTEGPGRAGAVILSWNTAVAETALSFPNVFVCRRSTSSMEDPTGSRPTTSIPIAKGTSSLRGGSSSCSRANVYIRSDIERRPGRGLRAQAGRAATAAARSRSGRFRCSPRPESEELAPAVRRANQAEHDRSDRSGAPDSREGRGFGKDLVCH